MLLFTLAVPVSASRLIPVFSLTFSPSWKLCGPAIAMVHADDIRRVHGVSQVQAGRNSNERADKCLDGANLTLTLC